MARQLALPGLRRFQRPSSTPSSPVVIGRKTEPVCRPMQEPLFFPDGGMALEGREPQYLYDEYKVRLRYPNGRAGWRVVSSDVYHQAAIGQTYVE